MSNIIVRLDAGEDEYHAFNSGSFRPTSISEIFRNPLVPLGNPLRSHCGILKYTFSNRVGLKTLRIRRRISYTVRGVRNMKL